MRFDIKNYIGNVEKYAMHCATQEEADVFCKYLHEQGMRWTNGDCYLETSFDTYKENTCYEFLCGKYAKLGWYLDRNYTVLEFSDFTWEGYRGKPEFRVFKTDMAVIDDFLSCFQVSV